MEFPPRMPNPTADQLRFMLYQLKTEAEHNLQNGRFQEALEGYTVALQTAFASPILINEIPKQLCNRSMVYYKMGKYQEALNDALRCIQTFQPWIKGYWRGSQAAKALGQTRRAIEILNDGLGSCVFNQSPVEDFVCIYAEIANILSQFRGEVLLTERDAIRSLPNDIARVKVVQRLVSMKSWEAVSYLVIGESSGNNHVLDKAFEHLDFSFINVGNLLKESTDLQLRNWGIDLAIALLSKGATFHQMELNLGKAAIHIGVSSALRTGSIEFLKFLFSTYIDSTAKKDMIDENGDSAVHVVVKSGRSNSTLGEGILRLLLNNGCTAYLKDMDGKIPIEYLKPTDQGYTLLQTLKHNADEEVRKQVNIFKNSGNQALKDNNYGKAIQMYTKGLETCGDNSSLTRESAVLLTNRSNVYSSMGMHRESLKDANEAIRVDNSWFKGYWRKGQELKQLKQQVEAYATFLEMLRFCTDVQTQDKINFIFEAAILFKDIPDHDRREKYKLLEEVDMDLWAAVLNKLSRSADWVTIQFFVMGLSTSLSLPPGFRGGGIASNADTSSMSFGTVFEFLKSVKHMGLTEKWLTPTLSVLLYRHGDNYLSFKADEQDTCVHAAVRYALITGGESVIQEIPISGTPFRDEYLDGRRENPYHVITKHKHTTNLDVMTKVAKVLIDKRFTCSMMDTDGKLAIDYVDQDSQKILFDILTKVTWKVIPRSQQSASSQKPKEILKPKLNLPTNNGMPPNDNQDIPKPSQKGDQATSIKSQPKPVNPLALKDIGNIEFKSGNYKLAASLYTEAIQHMTAEILQVQKQNRDLAILYGNRSECYLKLHMLDEAMNDATESVSYDGHWFKGHMKVGKVLGAQGIHEGALQAYTNALNELSTEPSPEKYQREILSSYCIHYMNLDRYSYPPDKKADVKVKPHIWAMVTYDFIAKGNLEISKLPYIQFQIHGIPTNVREKVNLQPLCVYQCVQRCSWLTDLIEYFLSCGSDVKTMKTNPDDKYFHSTVRLTVASGSPHLLIYVADHYVKPDGDENLQDNKGNTALHIITRATGVDGMLRLRVIYLLLEYDVNPTIKNHDQKYAIGYLPANESRAIEVLTIQMKQYEDMERRMKQQKKQQQQQRQQEEARRQESLRKPTVTTSSTSKPSKTNTKPDTSWIPKSTRPSMDRCGECRRVLEECKEKIKNKTFYAYNDMAAVMKKKGHNRDIHEKIVDQMIQMIIESIGRTLNPEIPERLAKVNYKYYERIVKGLIEGENWRQLDVVVEEHRKHHGPADLMDYAKGIKIQRVILHSSLKQSHQLMSKIIESMLKSGAIMENEGKKCIQAAIQEEQFKILETLFRHGACPSHLSVNQGDTPIHAALSIAVERDRGNFLVFNMFLEMFEKDPEKYDMCDPSQLDSNGDCLFHLIARTKYNSTVQKATELLCDRKISSNVKNKDGKLPIHYLNMKNDRRLQFFRLASIGGSVKFGNKKGKATQQKKIRTDIQGETTVDDVAMAEEEDLQVYERSEESSEVVEKPVVKQPLRKEALRRKIEELIYELDDAAYSKYSSRAEDLGKLKRQKKNETTDSETKEPGIEPKIEQAQEEEPKAEDEDESDEEESLEEQFQFDPQVFENLEWEVECTADVWKALRDKHVLPELKQRVVRKIQHLAAGEWTKHLCKKLHHVPETLRLYEAKISKGGRIIWELAIAFSPRLSESAERILESDENKTTDQPVRGGRIYSEIIRVWDVVFDHDKISPSVQKIVKSHTRGESCIIQKKLKGVKHDRYSNLQKRVPRIFAEAEIEMGALEEVKHLFPPASSNETEYHILKFYSFSSNLVSHILQNIEIKVDFPFRVTDLEHAIINLQSSAPILLLGRSGTGKTTCCLYRLWSRFLWYWTKAKDADAPLLPRAFIYRQQETIEEDDKNSPVEEEHEEPELIPVEIERQLSSGSGDGARAEQPANEGEEDVENNVGQQYDHLHQIFITKNAVLCNEVQKNFRELMHACDIAKNHVEIEAQNLPNKLQDVSEYQFPLFVTSRQLLLMLDASLEPPHFFERAEDGSLKVDIQGWTDGDGPLSILPLLQENSDEETDSEEEDDPDFLQDEEEPANDNSKSRKKKDSRKEMTYELFAETIWPHINKGVGKKYHPSLVWTEVMSFIKGSYEALSKSSGHLNKKEYTELGRKRAPNFSGEREEIYTLFMRYEHARKQKFLFDETDLVRDIYHRLCIQGELDWVIHQIFVDETQDFTQAELCLLLRLCQNPNEMFLTGDTAQSIMRGISFRFSDLKSLFFFASKSLQAMGKTSGVSIPKQVYQLTHNYRSHAGILSLASSILDLMVEFFPESFDRLNKDQGLFHGPQPILLESCSFSDLALLLRGNKRKTSHIEFGAHQAILVVNEAARENVPEVLQYGLILTIYESKGLEFDDILLYNFFKDSQASKEWRVVTDFLERLYDSEKSRTESLVKVSSDILQQKDRPRALTFDPNHHKVLNSELKHLYTAVTRARVNVWIFDEDMDKRAPMFEYFKARHLIKAISSDEVQNLSTGGMFAEESTPLEWTKRAEDFMRHNLYEVAAKCFRMGKDPYMEKVAISHHRALNASRIKDNPGKMREEFMLAAQHYLEVRMPVYAAKCLQNARERELLAHLYEKMGQLEQAAETYRKLRRPVESSACYERLGFFDKAIDTLHEHDMFDMAIDTLRRWTMQKKEFVERGQNMPQHLREHAPKGHTEERLSYKAAEMYHKTKNIGKMLASLNRLSSLQDRVNFLRKHHNHNNEYMSHAAKILRDNGQVIEAAQLYMDLGEIGQALLLARDVGRKDLIGYCLVIEACLETNISSSGCATADNVESTAKKVQEAFDIFKNLQNENCYKFVHHQTGAGEASLLYGQLTGDTTWINYSWGAFNKVKPSRNEAAQLDCMNWMVYNSEMSQRMNLVQVVKGMDNLYGVLEVLTSKNIEYQQRLNQIFRFYGLEPSIEKDLAYNPTLKPRIVNILTSQGMTVNEKLVDCKITVDMAKMKIALYLLSKGKEWYMKIRNHIKQQHQQLGKCPLYSVGITNQCKDPCDFGHHTRILEKAFNEQISLCLLFIELEYYVDCGARKILSQMSTELKKIQDSFYDPHNAEYASCQLLLSDLFNRFCRREGIVLTKNSEVYQCWRKLTRYRVRLQVERMLKTGYCVRLQVERMLKTRYEKIKDKNNKIRERSTDFFMNMVFLASFFRLDINIGNILYSFEETLTKEFRDGFILARNLEDLGFLVERDSVYGLVRRFLEAFEHLSGTNNEPQYAVRQFSKFIQLIRRQDYEPMLPNIDMMMMWIEFYIVVSFCLDLRYAGNKNLSCLIPSSYLSVVNLVETSFLEEHGIPTYEAINRITHIPEEDLIKNRTERLVGIIAGTDGKVNILRLAFHRLSESMETCQSWGGVNPEQPREKVNYTPQALSCISLAERVFVASLVFLCNMKKTVHTNSETHVMKEICRIQLPDHCPERLSMAVKGAQTATGIGDIVVCLKTLLTQRDDNLLRCWWQPRQTRRHGIVLETNIDMGLFNSGFYFNQTFEVLQNPDAVITTQPKVDDEEMSMTVEEKAKIEEDQMKYEETQRKNESALKIMKFLRHIRFLSNCGKLRELCEREKLKETKSGVLNIFSDVIVNENMCGICGEYFKTPEINEEDQEKGEITEERLIPTMTPTASTDQNTSGNIIQKLYSNVKGLVTGAVSGQLATPPSLLRPPSFQFTSSPTLQQQTNLHSEFPSLSDSNSSRQMGWTPLQKHERSLKHLDKQKDFKMFQHRYNTVFKKDIESARDFIEKYELRTARAGTLYPHISLDIDHLIGAFDKVVKDITSIKQSQNWKENILHQSVKEMAGYQSQIQSYVEEQYNQHSKTPTKKKFVQPHQDDDYYGDEADQIEDVVPQPKTREYVNSKMKHGRKRGGRR